MAEAHPVRSEAAHTTNRRRTEDCRKYEMYETSYNKRVSRSSIINLIINGSDTADLIEGGG